MDALWIVTVFDIIDTLILCKIRGVSNRHTSFAPLR